MRMRGRARAGLRAVQTTRNTPSVLPSSSEFSQLVQSAPGKVPWFPAHPVRNETMAELQRQLGRLVFDTSATKLATEVVSVAAALYASAFPTVHFENDGELVICTGLPGYAYPRGGICVGRVFLTGTPPSPHVIAHEKRHVAQWLRYGALLPVLYAASGREALTNWFEVQAGLADGNYL